MKYLYLIIPILILTISCNNMRIENNRSQMVKPKVFNCLIDSMGTNDTLYICFSTQGCFHYSNEELKIFRKSDSLFARLNVSIPHRQVFAPLIQYLNDSSIIAYSEFEKTGRTLNTSDGCTTREEYLVYIKSDSIKFKDYGCEFNGYNILKDKLFGQAKIKSYYEEIYR